MPLTKDNKEHTDRFIQRVELVIDFMATHTEIWLGKVYRSQLVSAVQDLFKRQDDAEGVNTISARQATRYIAAAEKWWNEKTSHDNEKLIERRIKQRERIHRRAYLDKNWNAAIRALDSADTLAGIMVYRVNTPPPAESIRYLPPNIVSKNDPPDTPPKKKK